MTGLILAGGQGLRMGGRDKGWVEHAGRPLIQHVIERLQPQVDSLIISANRSWSAYAALGHIVAADDPLGPGQAGPLAGIYAGLTRQTTPWLVVVPCDAPVFPSDLAVHLLNGLRDRRAGACANAAVAKVCGQVEPLFCLLGNSTAASLQQALRSGERKVARWLASIDAVEVQFDDTAAFANMNAPADLSPLAVPK